MIDSEILKMLAKAAEEAEKAEKEIDDDVYVEAKKEAQHIAKINKILFDAHIEAGFNEDAAFELTAAMISNL